MTAQEKAVTGMTAQRVFHTNSIHHHSTASQSKIRRGVSDLLSRLDKVQRTGNGRFKACCPAHADKSPSLAIREMEDGRILLHCFAGCDTESVLSAVGLTFADLMPEQALDHHKPRERRPFSAIDILAIVAHESMIAALCALDMAKGKELTEAERERLLLSASRLNFAVDVANGY